jgi:hypothetical protein
MNLKWIGAVLIAASIVIGVIIASNFQVYERVEDFALLADTSNYEKTKIEDQIVYVPPLNRTSEEAERLGKNWGWIGFNISLPNQGKGGYQAYGVIISADPNNVADVVMGVVNETGLDLLIFDGFSEQAWNASKVYATASIDDNKPYQKFWFSNLDNAQKYCVLFRGRKNATDDMPVIISIKEAWYEWRTLIQPAPLSSAATVTLFLSGISILIADRYRARKNGLKKRAARTSCR